MQLLANISQVLDGVRVQDSWRPLRDVHLVLTSYRFWDY